MNRWSEDMHVGKLINVELIGIQSGITVALLESEGTIEEGICDVCDGFLSR